jgi:hypothetical protein
MVMIAQKPIHVHKELIEHGIGRCPCGRIQEYKDRGVSLIQAGNPLYADPPEGPLSYKRAQELGVVGISGKHPASGTSAPPSMAGAAAAPSTDTKPAENVTKTGKNDEKINQNVTKPAENDTAASPAISVTKPVFTADSPVPPKPLERLKIRDYYEDNKAQVLFDYQRLKYHDFMTRWKMSTTMFVTLNKDWQITKKGQTKGSRKYHKVPPTHKEKPASDSSGTFNSAFHADTVPPFVKVLNGETIGVLSGFLLARSQAKDLPSSTRFTIGMTMNNLNYLIASNIGDTQNITIDGRTLPQLRDYWREKANTTRSLSIAEKAVYTIISLVMDQMLELPEFQQYRPGDEHAQIVSL